MCVMVRVDLITGFLGAGKTTFLHKYLHYLRNQGQRVRLIENEFGEINIDSMLLEKDDCEITDLTGLCMCCVGKDAFIRMLIRSAAEGCDRILVEPSGIYDVDEFFEVMTLPRVAAVCEIGSILTIADPTGMDYLTDEARYLLFSQLLASGMVVMSKTQCVSEEELSRSVDALDQVMIEHGCEGGLLADLCTKPWDELDEDDFEEFADAGYFRMVHDREIFSHSEAFGTANLIAHPRDEEDLRERLQAVFDSPSCGRVYRIKGFSTDDAGNRWEINSTAGMTVVRPASVWEEVLVVIGQQLRVPEIREILGRRS